MTLFWVDGVCHVRLSTYKDFYLSLRALQRIVSLETRVYIKYGGLKGFFKCTETTDWHLGILFKTPFYSQRTNTFTNGV